MYKLEEKVMSRKYLFKMEEFMSQLYTEDTDSAEVAKM